MPTCRWCGASGAADEFEQAPDGTGFWCPDCDGFSFSNEEDMSKHRFLLLLEKKSPNQDAACPSETPLPYPHLSKRLSPLRYPGGKSKLIDFLYSKLSSEKLNTFVEVFAGGASLGLSLLHSGTIQKLILNDIDPGVYALWHTILNAPQELTERLQGELPTHLDLDIAKRTLEAPDGPSPLLAWSFLLCNRLSYSGIYSANPMGGKNGSQTALLSRWNPQTLIDRINRIHSMRDRIELHCQDCCQLIEETVWWLPNTTLFIDPPYFEKGPQLYRHSFSEEDHRRLSDTLQTLYSSFPEADILITYDDHPYIRNLYPLAQQESIPRTYSIKTSRIS